MKIGLLSDTHGYLDDRILHFLSSRDEIWHAGDWGGYEVAEKLQALAPVRGVYGNIDGRDIRLTYPEELRFNAAGLEVYMIHIGGYPGKYSPKAKQSILANPPGLFICGHSHILKVMRDPKLGLLHINPGAAGIHGFHKVRTLVLFEINDGKVEKVQAVELGKRSEL